MPPDFSTTIKTSQIVAYTPGRQSLNKVIQLQNEGLDTNYSTYIEIGTVFKISPIQSPRRGFSKLHFVHWLDGLNPLDGEVCDSSNGEPVEHGVGDTVGRMAVDWAGDGHGQGSTGKSRNDLHLQVILGGLAGDGQGLGDAQGRGKVHHRGLFRQGVLEVPLGHHTSGCGDSHAHVLGVGEVVLTEHLLVQQAGLVVDNEQLGGQLVAEVQVPGAGGVLHVRVTEGQLNLLRGPGWLVIPERGVGHVHAEPLGGHVGLGTSSGSFWSLAVGRVT